jgi:hypothetical protein
MGPCVLTCLLQPHGSCCSGPMLDIVARYRHVCDEADLLHPQGTERVLTL